MLMLPVFRSLPIRLKFPNALVSTWPAPVISPVILISVPAPVGRLNFSELPLLILKEVLKVALVVLLIVFNQTALPPLMLVLPV